MSKTNDPQDDELRGWLRGFGRALERRAPAFQSVWRSACESQTTGGSGAWQAPLRWAFAVVLVFAGGLTVALMTHRPDRDIAITSRSNHAAQMAPPVVDGFDQDAPMDFLLADNREAPPPNPVEHLAREIDALLRP